MPSNETIGTEQFSGLTAGDAARWFLSLVLVAGLGAGGVVLARNWTPPPGEASVASAPAVLLELEPLAAPAPEVVPPEPLADPVPEPQPEVEPTRPDPEAAPSDTVPDVLPETVQEPIAEPEVPAEPPPVVEEPVPEPELAEVPQPLPEPQQEPVAEPEPVTDTIPEPLPMAEAPDMAFPMPAMMSADLQQRRADTPATNPQRPRPTPPPERPRTQQPAPQQPPVQQQPPPSSPAASANAGVTQDEWKQQVQRRINRNKVYSREAQRAGLVGVVQVSVTIDQSGRLLSATLVRSSGIAVLDEAAVEAVRRASPFPRPPASAGQGSIAFVAPIRFSAQ